MKKKSVHKSSIVLFNFVKWYHTYQSLSQITHEFEIR